EHDHKHDHSEHQHDHDHKHDHNSEDHSDHSSHDHSAHDHSAHDHSAHDHSAHDHSDHLAIDGFTSLSFQSDKPFNIKKFQYFLDNQIPEAVFRAKGILWFDESPKRHIFHLSGKRFSLDDEQWKNDDRKNQLVLIGQNLDHDKLRAQIESCIATPSNTRARGFGK
ncbi:MAG: GTP-binding protein, partial [Alkalinema sp. FL-bin-369]|nr:GTP-binding protein [Leptolyngbyaceae cyanobacterium LF-bin-369]